jgi:hypothetical protein
MRVARLLARGVERGFAFGARAPAEIIDRIAFHEICPRMNFERSLQRVEKQAIIREVL